MINDCHAGGMMLYCGPWKSLLSEAIMMGSEERRYEKVPGPQYRAPFEAEAKTDHNSRTNTITQSRTTDDIYSPYED
jgi:hypothetical protein